MEQLSINDARRLSLKSQGLHAPNPFGTGKDAVQRCIEHLGYIQIDTISVINRSHHHAFWTRVPSYREQHLDDLLKDRRIMEYWAHAASYLPMQDYRYCLPYMRAITDGQIHWRKPDRKTMAWVLERVRAEGPLMARDFEQDKGNADEWGWNWKPAKIALEQLFIEGQLMISHRVGFQKVYDLPERVLPTHIDTCMPSDEEFYRYLVLSTLRAHGLAQEAEFSYLRKGIKAAVKATLQDMLHTGELITVQVGNLPGTWYTTADILESLSGTRVSRSVHLLSPFDNAVIKRKRIQHLFDSDYQIECYVTEAKRRFGYYCLPILYGTEIVGRLDPKADRKNGCFSVKSMHLEKEVKDPDAFFVKLANKLRDVATFNHCHTLTCTTTRDNSASIKLASALTG